MTETFNLKDLVANSPLVHSTIPKDLELQKHHCCDDPVAEYSEMVGGCCAMVYCENCRALWYNFNTEGHTLTDHSGPRSPEEREQMKKQRRRRRRKMRKEQR